MKIPQYTRQEEIRTGSTAAFGPREGFGPGQGLAILGGGLSRAIAGGANLAEAQQYINERKADQDQKLIQALSKQKIQDLALESDKSYLQLRSDWNERLRKYAENPTEDVMATALGEYDSYVTKMLESASPGAKTELSLKAQDFRIDFSNKAYQLQTVTRQRNFGASFDQMLSNATDSIYATRDVQELVTQQTVLDSTIAKAFATGRIRDPETAQALKGKVDMLGVTWADSVMGTEPELVLQALENPDSVLKGVPGNVKYTLENRAKQSIESLKELDKTAIRLAHESDKIQRMRTGQGNAWSYDAHAQAFGETSAKAAQKEIDLATQLFTVSQELRGATDAEIKSIFDRSKPKSDPTSSSYHQEDEYHRMVQKLTNQAFEDKKEDPYTYYIQDPVIDGFIKQAAADPKAVDSMVIQDAILEAQRRDNIPEYNLKIMPKDEAKKFIADFNGLLAVGSKATADDVHGQLMQFTARYQDNSNVALSQLNATQGGDKITGKMNPLMWHLGNRDVFRGIVDAIRKPAEEVDKRFKDSKDKAEFYVDVGMDKNFMLYSASIMGGNNSPEAFNIMSGVREAYTAYAKDYVLNGGRMKDASKTFFSPYTFGSHNGAVYARPTSYTRSSDMSVHSISEDMAEISDNFLATFPRTLDPNKVEPASILNIFKIFTPEQQLRDVKNALDGNTFWVTTPDETGVTLFTSGSIIGQPRMVKYKDGTPIRVNFEDTFVVPEPTRVTPTFEYLMH